MVDGVPRQLGGRYEVGGLLGRGGMAEVHIGRDTRLHRTVAIKVLRSDLARDPTFQARFKREAQSAAALNHPAIVAAYDTGEDIVTSPSGIETRIPYIVMEYVEGHTVRDLLKDGNAVPIEEAVEIVSGVLGALEYSHHAGIVHRDIKPGNVMLTPTGAVKVMDFGIARALADSHATMTQTHAVVGTAQYLSPEQARGEIVDTRSDLYSTGCLLFELLTGRPPFVADSPVAVAYQHVSEPPPAPSDVATDVPEALDRVTVKALTKDRNQRYQTAAEFRADLEAAVHGGKVSAPTVGSVPAPTNPAAATAVISQVSGATRVMPAASPATPTREAEQGPAEDEPKGRRGLVWLLVLIGMLTLGGIVALALQAGGPFVPRMVDVPDLTGMNEAQAREELTAAELEMSVETAPSETVDDGLAISWEPNDQAEAGTTVVVTFSTGPSVVTIPDVTGLTQALARRQLQAEGLTGEILTTQENAPDTARDIVVRTDPGAGSEVASNSSVTLVLATGNVDVPDLTGQPEADAEAALRALGVSVRIERVTSDGEPGIVIRQDRSGAIPIDATVALFISQAAPTPDPEPEQPPEENDDDG